MKNEPRPPTGSAAYTTDVDFNSSFAGLQAPVHLSLAAALRGWHGPDVSEAFTYFDIACGNGAGLAVLAAAYPRARFVGYDLNPRHIAQARDKIERAGLTNVELVETDIVALETLDTGHFDFAVVSGAYTWLDSARQQCLRRFLSRCGAPGALVFLDYAAQPGSAAADALYHVLRTRAATHSGDSATRLRAGAEELATLAQRGALFFKAYPTALHRLRDMNRQNAADEAHEVFNLQGGGIWFSQVNEDMEAAGFHWANAAALSHTVPSLCPPADVAGLSDCDPIAAQLLFDVARNTSHRADVFIKRGARRSTVCEALATRPLAAIRGDATPRMAKFGRRLPLLGSAQAKAVIAPLTGSEISMKDLTHQIQQAGMDAETLVQGLLATSILQVYAQKPLPISDPPTRVAFTNSFNRAVVFDDIGKTEPRPLASPVAGSGIVLPLIDRLALLALAGGDMHATYTRLQQVGMDTDSAFGPGGASFVAKMSVIAERFASSGAVDLRRLGILEP